MTLDRGKKKPTRSCVHQFVCLLCFLVLFLFHFRLVSPVLVKICMYAKPSPWETHIYMKMPIVGTLFTEIKDFLQLRVLRKITQLCPKRRTL